MSVLPAIPLFTADHRLQLQKRGFTRVESVIPKELTSRVLDSLTDVSSIDFNDHSTWYNLPDVYPGIIPSHHHQSQWDIRQHPRLFQVFSELWGSTDLWVSMDRIAFVPPMRAHEPVNCTLHWDMDPRTEFIWQAMVYLTDAPTKRAPFTAAPDVFQNLMAWWARHPELTDFSEADFSNEESVMVPGNAGDLIIWDSRLPHGPGPNRNQLPRVMQAVTMFPASRAHWCSADQIEWWQSCRAPPWWRDVPGQRDPEPGPPAALTYLGRQLVGVDADAALP
jgi:Phytanoyl-CoA dioxygenase (PhyH)